MSKHIDAEAFKEWIKNWFYKHKSYHPYAKTNTIPITELYDILEQMPAADVVKVCRCGECENWKADFPYNTCALYGGRWNENMFCSYGQRRKRKG